MMSDVTTTLYNNIEQMKTFLFSPTINNKNETLNVY